MYDIIVKTSKDSLTCNFFLKETLINWRFHAVEECVAVFEEALIRRWTTRISRHPVTASGPAVAAVGWREIRASAGCRPLSSSRLRWLYGRRQLCNTLFAFFPYFVEIAGYAEKIQIDEVPETNR